MTFSPLLLSDPVQSPLTNSPCGPGSPSPIRASTMTMHNPTEQLFQHASAILLSPPEQTEAPPSSRRRWFVVTLILFALVLLAFHSAIKVGIIVGVIFFHELGHYV